MSERRVAPVGSHGHAPQLGRHLPWTHMLTCGGVTFCLCTTAERLQRREAHDVPRLLRRTVRAGRHVVSTTLYIIIYIALSMHTAPFDDPGTPGGEHCEIAVVVAAMVVMGGWCGVGGEGGRVRHALLPQT